VTNSISDRSLRPCNGLMELNKMNELKGKTKVFGEKNCLSAPFFTTNPTCTGLGSTLGLLGESLATNHLIHGRDLHLLCCDHTCMLFDLSVCTIRYRRLQ
jgi:hypothetical protein